MLNLKISHPASNFKPASPLLDDWEIACAAEVARVAALNLPEWGASLANTEVSIPSTQPKHTIISSNTGSVPNWADSARGAPNVWLRGALFSAIQGKERRALKREVLATVSGVSIRFTGWQLDQSDLDVWETLVHLAIRQKSSNQIEFTAHAILVELDRGVGKQQHEWLKDAIARLYSAGIELTSDKVTYFGALLKGSRDEATGRYKIELEPKLLALYQAGWTCMNWEQRQQLRRKPLAQWLHGWYGSHNKAYPMKIETLRKLSGSRNGQLAGFRRQLGKALGDLQTVKAIKSWEFKDGLLHVETSFTPKKENPVLN
ncbi:MAG: plasmid replication initiator TrfA [Candidatus Nanopelagicales bacterium]